MTPHLIVQASGAMFESDMQLPWCSVFGVFVTNEEGAPIKGLVQGDFSVWELAQFIDNSLPLVMAVELNELNPQSHMPGIYRVQTVGLLPSGAHFPEQYVFAIRVVSTKERTPREGMTTVPITFLGP